MFIADSFQYPFNKLIHGTILLVLLSVLYCPVQTFADEVSNITSTIERIISYRNQEHMWSTSDGVSHILINRGEKFRNKHLHLLQNVGTPKDWQPVLSFPGSDNASTSDGFLVNDILHVVYSTASGGIRYSRSSYQNNKGVWNNEALTAVTTENPAFAASIPTVAIDDRGILWCSSTIQEIESGLTFIKVMYSLDNGMTWLSISNLQSGETEFQKASRMVAMQGKIGMISTGLVLRDAEIVSVGRWFYLSTQAPLDVEWEKDIIWETPHISGSDPFGTHFNALVNPDFNLLHLVTIQEGKVLYCRYDGFNEQWDDQRTLTSPAKTAYTQLTRSLDGKLLITYNILTNIAILESSDNGDSFVSQYYLTHPNSPFADFSNPRIECPSVIDNSLTILQQVNLLQSERLFQFDIQL